MENDISTGIEVTAEIHLGGMKHYTEVKTAFTPDVLTLSTQIDTLMQKIQVRARAMLLQEYADRLVEISNSINWSTSNERNLTVYVSIRFAYVTVKSFCGNEVDFTLEDVAETKIFEWGTIDRVKESLAFHALESFSELKKH